ncbi:MAG TPA: 4Fe-4S dicluster domain-containing protein [Symbiobacteriaceae bacterium]|nr:4Fe-4S dicluster domain-containing protein [Symbiobacteriaceae bacterium]
MGKGVLVDVTKCIGCRGCQMACKQWNEIPAEKTRFTGGTNPPTITPKSWTRIDARKVITGEGEETWRFVKSQCMHCEYPPCEAGCPVGAITKTADGPVVYDPERCIGCRYCLYVCPYDGPAFQWDERFGLKRKCLLCDDRIAAGMGPACVTACPVGTLTFGERNELIARAEKLIAEHPEKYINHIYGKDELGGTSWLYISDVPFAELGLMPKAKQPLPTLVQPAMAAVPWVALTVGGLMSGLYFYTHRREQVAAAGKGREDA